MSDQTYIATGQVIDRDTDQGVAKLSVEAWDSSLQRDQALGSGETDENGRFSITLDLVKLKYETPPDLFFKILRDGQLLESTESSVSWNANTQEDVTIRIRTVRQRAEGVDRVTSEQVFKGVDFFQKSDFKGVFNEVKGRTGTSLGFIVDMFKNSLTNMDLNPVQVTGVKHEDVINQDVNVAQRNLEAKKITVKEVVAYQPGLNAASLGEVTAMSKSLRPGQQVRLYEENGQVKYYSIVKSDDATAPAGASSGTAPGGAPAASGGGVTSTQLNSLQDELNTARQDAVKKDETINALKDQIATLQKQQSDVNTLLKSDSFVKLMAKMNDPSQPK